MYLILCYTPHVANNLPRLDIISASARFFSSVSNPLGFDMDLDPRIHTTGLRIRILLFSSVAFKMPTKNQQRIVFFLSFLCLLFSSGTFTSSFRNNKLLRSHKVTKLEIYVFIDFLPVDERIRIQI